MRFKTLPCLTLRLKDIDEDAFHKDADVSFVYCVTAIPWQSR